jgi:branched-subunit amino acid transport protein
MDGLAPWLIVLGGAAITYVWRALGVVVAGRFAPDGAAVRWVGCVAYAMLAGLFARMILLPAGQLAQVPLSLRVGAVLVAVVAWFLAGRSVFLGTCAGVATVIALMLWG